MPTNDDLLRLLALPSESLSVEYKSWLDLSNNRDKAIVAKAAIAIANEGGGIIVLGMRANNVAGGDLESQPRPAELGRMTHDLLNASIGRYADPEFHCDLLFAVHPVTHVEHAFVVIPGGAIVPIMSCRAYDGVIEAQRCYVRKPGPRSEEPFTAEEWRGVFERCLYARRENMLNAIRMIVEGRGSIPPPSEAERVALTNFRSDALARWNNLQNGLNADDPARMRLGHYEIAFAFHGVNAAPNLISLRERMESASRIKHTGWGPFVILHRAPLEPRPVGGHIEAWFGTPEDQHEMRAVHCDFWRASAVGRFFLLRGYDEDSSDRALPGAIIDLTLPIWRVGETLLYASRLGREFGDNPEALVTVRYTGLRSRRLGSLQGIRRLFEDRICADEDAVLETRTTASELDENLVEVLHTLLAPLYERFSFFDLPRGLVAGEIEEMRRHRF